MAATRRGYLRKAGSSAGPLVLAELKGGWCARSVTVTTTGAADLERARAPSTFPYSKFALPTAG
jgi:hypothetical protein